jgi:hypothetical protein
LLRVVVEEYLAGVNFDSQPPKAAATGSSFQVHLLFPVDCKTGYTNEISD